MEAQEARDLVRLHYAKIAKRRPDLIEWEEYYLGKQKLAFATQQWREKAEGRYKDFADNWCRPVVDAAAERIDVKGIKTESREASRFFTRQWFDNELDFQSSQGFLTTLYGSRSYVLVWGEEGQTTWEHPQSVDIEMAADGSRKYTSALKTWADDQAEYATLYTPDEVWKFQRDRHAPTMFGLSQAERQRVTFASAVQEWTPREVRGETWPMRNPLGEVPVTEVPNRPMLAGDPVSEVKAIIPLQHAVNLVWAYGFLGLDSASLPARIVTGADVPEVPVLNDKGEIVGSRPLTKIERDIMSDERFLLLTGEKVGVHEWSPGKLDVFTDFIGELVAHISSQTRTPPTYFATSSGLSNVSADGLKASEIPLVRKVREFQTFASPAIRRVAYLQALARGENAIAEELRRGITQWADPEIRSESQLSDAQLKKKSTGYPFEYLLEMEGHDQVEIDRIMEMRRQEAENPVFNRVEEKLNAFELPAERPAGDESALSPVE